MDLRIIWWVILGGSVLFALRRSQGRTASTAEYLDDEGRLLPRKALALVAMSKIKRGPAPAEVERLLLEARSAHPDDPDLAMAWAHLYPEQALETLAQAIEKCPDNVELRLSRVGYRDSHTQYDEIMADIGHILQSGDEKSAARASLRLARVHADRQENTQAEALLDSLTIDQWAKVLEEESLLAVGSLYKSLRRGEKVQEVLARLQKSSNQALQMLAESMLADKA
ncbi:MAG: hypothetical protein KC910_11175 [Candidatus Eremiobacteraeota bacterium]|nr:hypothetical protein [Candidatus Eremiobacteraeota bacterium]